MNETTKNVLASMAEALPAVLQIANVALPGVLTLAITHGVPLVLETIQALGKDTITEEDLAALESLVKDPATYRSKPQATEG